MFRYFVELSYCGTNYCGWQIQKNAVSVQQILNNAFSTYFRKPIELIGAGRTDTGVHAIHYVAHFEIDTEIKQNNIPLVIYKLNAILPKTVSLQKIYLVDAMAHARFSAIRRTYQYIIATEKEAFLQTQTYQYTKPLDINAMNLACKYLIGNLDFTSFSKLHSDVTNNLCTVEHAIWEEINSDNSLQLYNNQKFYKFTIVSNRFLRNMVRSIVGTLLDVGKGKITVQDFKAILDAKNRALAGSSAPAQGLYLINIEYPMSIYDTNNQ